MRRTLARVLISIALLGGTVALSGCVIAPPRAHAGARVWVPGFWSPVHVWVGGHWRDR